MRSSLFGVRQDGVRWYGAVVGAFEEHLDAVRVGLRLLEHVVRRAPVQRAVETA